MIRRLLYSYPVRFAFLGGVLTVAAGIILIQRLLSLRPQPAPRLPN